MPNIMDNANYTPMGPAASNDFQSVLQQARNNPRAFEEHIKRTNPQAYQMAMQLRNGQCPQEVIFRLAQQRGIDPNILRMLNL